MLRFLRIIRAGLIISGLLFLGVPAIGQSNQMSNNGKPLITFSLDSIEPGYISRQQCFHVQEVHATSIEMGGKIIEHKIISCSISIFSEVPSLNHTSEHIPGETNHLSATARNILMHARGGDDIILGNVVLEDVKDFRVTKSAVWQVIEPGMSDTDCHAIRIYLDKIKGNSISMVQAQDLRMLYAEVNNDGKSTVIPGKIISYHLTIIHYPHLWESKNYDKATEPQEFVYSMLGPNLSNDMKKHLKSLSPGDIINFTHVRIQAPAKKTYSCGVTYKITS